MTDLATPDDLALLLGLSEVEAEGSADLLQMLLDQAEALFEAETNRSAAPFQAAVSGRVEVQESQPSCRLWLDYPVAEVSEITLGLDPLALDAETLDPADPLVIHSQVGRRELVRVDGGTWESAAYSPSWIWVTYDSQADLPADATAAVLRLAAAQYRTLGAEGVQSETLDNYSVTFATQAALASAVPEWGAAVARHRRFAFV